MSKIKNHLLEMEEEAERLLTSRPIIVARELFMERYGEINAPLFNQVMEKINEEIEAEERWRAAHND